MGKNIFGKNEEKAREIPDYYLGDDE